MIKDEATGEWELNNIEYPLTNKYTKGKTTIHIIDESEEECKGNCYEDYKCEVCGGKPKIEEECEHSYIKAECDRCPKPKQIEKINNDDWGITDLLTKLNEIIDHINKE